MNRRKNTGHWRTLFAGPDNATNDALLRVAEAYAREAGTPLLRVDDDAALSAERPYYRQFYYPLVMVSPRQDGDTLAWLRILTALGFLDTGFFLFFCGQPERFPLEYFRDRFLASLTLDVKDGLKAGKYTAGQEIATGSATASAGTVAYRWSPASGKVQSPVDGLSKVITLTGKARSENTITVALAGTGVKDGGLDGWIVPAAPGTSSLTFSVQNYQEAVISPDTYTLSVDAAVWGY